MFNTIRGKVTLGSIVIVGILNVFLSVYIFFIINNKLESTIQDNMNNIKFIARNLLCFKLIIVKVI